MWKRFNELRKVDKNYSGMSYSYERAKKMGLLPQKYAEGFMKVHTVAIYEMLEITYNQEEGILCKTISDRNSSRCNENFKTQFGVFQNSNHGEFGGQLTTPSGMSVNGNFVEIIDHKDKVYAIDSLKHFGVAHFNLLEFESPNKYRVIYKTKNSFETFDESEHLGFGALYDTGEALYFVISGCVLLKREDKHLAECTKILKVQDSQVIEVLVLDEVFSWIKNLIVIGNIAYVSMDKMVAQIDLSTGNVEYFTWLSEEAERDLLETRKLQGFDE